MICPRAAAERSHSLRWGHDAGDKITIPRSKHTKSGKKAILWAFIDLELSLEKFVSLLRLPIDVQLVDWWLLRAHSCCSADMTDLENNNSLSPPPFLPL